MRAACIPKSIYLTTFAVTTLLTRPFLGRFGDRIGYRRIFLPSLVVMTLGMIALTFSDTRLGLAVLRRRPSRLASGRRTRRLPPT